jgi:hypothetical protein
MIARPFLLLLLLFVSGSMSAQVQYDLAVTEFRAPWFTYPERHVTITGDIRNQGAAVVNSFDLHYTVNGGNEQVMTVSGITLPVNGLYEFFHEAIWIPATPGSHEIVVWASNINGQADQVPDNDAASATSRVLEPIPVIVDQYLFGEPVVEVIAGQGQDLLVPRDLDFHPDPSRNELWVVNKELSTTGGSTVRFFGPGETGMEWLWQRDPAAWHFMSLPTGIAFGDNNNFATCPGIFDANQSGGNPFTGPTLWDSDPQVYAQPFFGNLGSHIDMLHVNPQCQGIAHDTWNRYWVVDGYNGDITMNDFRKDHGPGFSWHGDAIIRRYADFTITRDPNDHITSHTVLDKATGWLYVVDHGGQRVLRLDINTGSVSGAPSFGPFENYVEYSMVTGYTWQEVVTTGLVQPAGIEVIGGRLLVSDHATGEIIIFDLSQSHFPELGRIATGQPGIMGITVGPDGRIWYVNATTHQLGRISPDATVGVRERRIMNTFQVHPVPASSMIVLPVSEGLDATGEVEVMDVAGRMIARLRVSDLHRGWDVSGLPNGSYTLRVLDGGAPRTARAIVQH